MEVRVCHLEEVLDLGEGLRPGLIPAGEEEVYPDAGHMVPIGIHLVPTQVGLVPIPTPTPCPGIGNLME